MKIPKIQEGLKLNGTQSFAVYESRNNIFVSAGVFGFSPFCPSHKMGFSLICLLNDFGTLLNSLRLFTHLLLTPPSRAPFSEHRSQ